MRFEAVLAQAEIASWVGAISTSAAMIVALIALWEIRRTVSGDRALGLFRSATLSEVPRGREQRRRRRQSTESTRTITDQEHATRSEWYTAYSRHV